MILSNCPHNQPRLAGRIRGVGYIGAAADNRSTGLPTVTDGDFIVPSQTRYWPSYLKQSWKSLVNTGFINTDNYDTHYLSTLFAKAEARLARMTLSWRTPKLRTSKPTSLKEPPRRRNTLPMFRYTFPSLRRIKRLWRAMRTDVNAWAAGLKKYDT